MALAGVAPFADAVRSSFYATGADGREAFAGLANYRSLLTDRGFLMSAGITAAWAALSATVSLCCAFPLAMLAMNSKRAAAVLFPLLVAVWAVPVYIGAPLWRFLLHGAGGESAFKFLTGVEVNLMESPVASFLATALVSAWFRLPQAALIIYAAAGRSRKTLDEAARLDGAGPAALAFSIRLPRMKGTMVAVAALELVSAVKEFTVPFLLTAGGPPMRAGVTDRTVVGATTTLEIYLYDMFSSYADRGSVAAYSAVLSAVILLVVLAGLAVRKASIRSVGADLERPARRIGRVPGRLADGVFTGWSTAVAILLAVSVAALAWCMLWMAFSGLSVAFVDSLLPRYPSTAAFSAVFVDDAILGTFLNTILVSLMSAGATVAVAFPAAAWLAERPPSWTAAAFAALQALSSAGGVHSLVPLYELWNRLGLVGGYAPVVLVYLYHALPAALLALSTYLRDRPPALRDVATLEGMGRFAWMTRVQLPLALPVIGATAMLAFLAAWNGFLAPLIFIDDDARYTIAVRLHAYVGSIASGSPKWNRFAVASLVNVAIVGALFVRFRKPMANSALADVSEED